MSLAPGCKFDGSGRIVTTSGAAQVADFINQGIGFMNDGSVAVDTNAPAATPTFINGIAVNGSGALHGKTGSLGTDVFLEGVRVSILGQVVYGTTVAVAFNNGNGTVAAADKIAFTN